jgi:hypothetical protein
MRSTIGLRALPVTVGLLIPHPPWPIILALEFGLPVCVGRRELDRSLRGKLGQSLIQRGQWSATEPVPRECLAIREKSQPDEWSTFNTRSTLGGSLLGQKKFAEAEPLSVSGYECMKAREAKIPPPGKPRLTEAAERVVKVYEAWGKKDKAAEWRARLAKPSDEAKPRP